MTEKVLLVYATMSGNTEAMADLIEKGLTEAGASVDRHEAMDIDAELLNDYSHIMLGRIHGEMAIFQMILLIYMRKWMTLI